MNNGKYWSKRYEELMTMELGKAEKVDESLQRAYLRSTKKIEELIRSWYARYMNVNDISLAEAHKELHTRDRNEFLWTVQDYIENGKADNLSAEIKQMLENASIKYHVTRLEAIQAQLVMQLNELFTQEQERVSTLASEIYQSAYYHSIYERELIKKKLSSFNVLPTDAIRIMLEKPYASDGLNFSQRIYKNRDKVIKEVNSILLSGLIQGRNSDRETRELAGAIVDELTVNDTIEDIKKKMRNARIASKRLILTEASFFANQGVANSCKELGSEQYQLIATLDTHTSSICQRMDLQVFPVDQMVVGVNFPPFHPYCRTVVAPYDEFQDEKDTRIARDKNGNTIYVPHDMKYEEWYNTYVDGEQIDADVREVFKNIRLKVGNFISPKETLTEALGDYTEDVRALIDKAPSQHAKIVWNKYERKIGVIDLHRKSVRAFFSAKEKGISLNIDEDAEGGVLATPPFSKLFHECGHNIDWLAGGGKGTKRKNYFSVKYKNNALGKAIQEDFKSLKQQLVWAYGERVYNNGWDWKEVSNILKQELHRIYNVQGAGEYRGVSDILSALTKDSKGHLGFRHKPDYWEVDPLRLTTEAFAQMFKASMINPKEVAIFKSIYPRGYEVFTEILKELSKNGY